MSKHSAIPHLVKPRASAVKAGVVGASPCPSGAPVKAQRGRKGQAGGDAPRGARPPAAPAAPFLVLKETTQSTHDRPPPSFEGLKRVDAEAGKEWDTLQKSPAGTLVCCRKSDGSTEEICRDREGRIFVRKTSAAGEVVQGWFGSPLSSYQRKQKFAVTENTAAFIEQVGENSVGFLTLTFEDNLRCPREAQRRFNSFWSNVGRDLFGAYLRVIEFQKRGAVHYHLLVACPVQIKGAFDWDAFLTAQECFRRGDMSGHRQLTRAYVQRLKDEGGGWLVDTWATLRRELPKYGLGRSELVPVRSNFEGMAKYIGKYLEKGCGHRPPEQKGVRMFNASLKGWTKRVSMRFQFLSDGSGNFRSRVARLADHLGASEAEGLTPQLGPKWAYRLKPWLMPSFEGAESIPCGGARWVAEEMKFAELMAMRPAQIRAIARAADRVGEGKRGAHWSLPERQQVREWERVAPPVPAAAPPVDDWDARRASLVAKYGVRGYGSSDL